MSIMKNISESFLGNRELVSVNYTQLFDNIHGLNLYANSLFTEMNIPQLQRFENEYHYHTYLEQQLFTKILEIKAYSEVDVMTSRRMVSVTSECITSIQLLIRDSIHLNVYFRSSDYDNALVGDLLFLTRIPNNFINFLEAHANDKGFEEVNDELINTLRDKAIQLNLYFGSLHRTN